MRAGVSAGWRRAVEPDDEVTLRTAAVAFQRGLGGGTPYRVHFTVTIDPDDFLAAVLLHPEAVRESEAWARGQQPRP